MRHIALYPLLGLVLLSTACLSSGHRISKGELQSLVRIAPEQRGNQVRVVQGLGGSDDPPAADRVSSGTHVYVHSPIWIGGHPSHHQHGQSSGSVGTGSAGGVHGQPGGYNGPKIAKGEKEAAAALLIPLAAVVALGLAATEGARYDGWVRLHPMHPVHLIGPYGEHTVLPLAHIDERAAQWAHHAIVRESEGPWQHLGRAPLDRQGLTYSLFLGAGTVPVKGFPDADPGFVGHIQFGYFFSQNTGLQLDLGMAWTEDNQGETIYSSRTSLELQSHILQSGPIHAGLFGQIGVASRYDDGIGFDDSSSLLGAGALLQLDLTTRLALTGRFGAVRTFGENSSEIGIGLSIY